MTNKDKIGQLESQKTLIIVEYVYYREYSKWIGQS